LANNSNLKEVQQRLLRGPVGRDAIARTYIDKIERSDATAAQINDFAIYISRRAYFADAREYLQAAVDLEPQNPTLWLNLGTVEMKRQRWSDAMSAFKKVVEIDPNNAFAYYNLGAAYDESGNYDEAVKNYLYALRLDPSLADPKVNPQVVNNNQRLVVELLAYRFRQGSLGLPMQPIATAAPSAPKAAPGTAPGQPAPNVPPAGTEKK
jgi:tetratricopeptide (TPR) repeat protein